MPFFSKRQQKVDSTFKRCNYTYMAKKILPKKVTANPLSQFLIGATVVIILVASYQAVSQNDITSIAPTQLFLVAAVLAVLGLYLKD